MPIWFDADGQNGRVAIYTGTDDAPLHNPTAYIGTRTKLHTDWNYIPFVPAKMITRTISVPNTENINGRVIDLGGHGIAGVPFIFGRATVGGVVRPLCGTVPIFVNTANGNCIHWTLGVNTTNVFLAEGRTYHTLGGGLSIPIQIFISDKLAA